MKKILITGGAGFIGSNLCNKLVSDNFVYCLDNLYTSSIENISNLLNHPNFEFIQHDITEKIDLEVDEIYNRKFCLIFTRIILVQFIIKMNL